MYTLCICIYMCVCVCVCVKLYIKLCKAVICGTGSYVVKVNLLSLNPYSYVCLLTMTASTVITNLLFCLCMLKVISRMADD